MKFKVFFVIIFRP